MRLQGTLLTWNCSLLQDATQNPSVCVLTCSTLFGSLQPHGLQPETPLSMEFSGQKHWNGLPVPPPGILLTQGSNPGVLKWQASSLPLSHRESPKPQIWSYLPKLERCPPMLRVLYAFSSPVKDETKESNSNQGYRVFQVVEKALFVSILTFSSNSLSLSLAIMLPRMYCAPSPSPHWIFHSLVLLPEGSPSSLLSHLFPTHHWLEKEMATHSSILA